MYMRQYVGLIHDLTYYMLYIHLGTVTHMYTYIISQHMPAAAAACTAAAAAAEDTVAAELPAAELPAAAAPVGRSHAARMS